MSSPLSLQFSQFSFISVTPVHSSFPKAHVLEVRLITWQRREGRTPFDQGGQGGAAMCLIQLGGVRAKKMSIKKSAERLQYYLLNMLINKKYKATFRFVCTATFNVYFMAQGTSQEPENHTPRLLTQLAKHIYFCLNFLISHEILFGWFLA